jgi:hypothetical protein
MKLDTLFSKAVKPQATNIKTKVACITPAFALACLKDFNNSNRPMSQGVAKLYANEMLRGQWKCNGEPIIFSIDDAGMEHLISGQHRLQGLVLAQQALEKEEIWPTAQTEWDAVIVYGVPHDTADTVDTGKSRTHSDVLFRDPWIDTVIPEGWNDKISRRKTWTKTLAGAARLVWLIEGGAIVSSAPKFLISEMLDFLQSKHPELCTFVTMVLDANEADADNKGLKMSLPYIAALVYVASIGSSDEQQRIVVDEDPADKLDGFINELAVGTGYEKGDPAWALAAYWNKLTSEPGSKDRDRDWVGPFVKAASAVLAGKTGLKVSDIALTKKERDGYNDFPVMFDGYHTECFERAAAAKARLVRGIDPHSGKHEVGHVHEDDTPDTQVEQEEAIEVDTPAEAAPKRPRPKRKAKKATVVA